MATGKGTDISCIALCGKYTNNQVHYGMMVVLICLHINATSLSSLCRCTRSYWTSKMLVRCILPRVCLRLNQFSQLSFIQDMQLCVFSLHIYPMMIVRICVLYLIIIIKSAVWSICHCLGSGLVIFLPIFNLSAFAYIQFKTLSVHCQRQGCVR